ncbi:hypothetical protein [Streptomyces sp. NPDC085540]|uniref:hypothetical protein n=1 Tax=Streptomyces sp. NPDC085540 TaxID=3365730 RepID=UPI0037D91588
MHPALAHLTRAVPPPDAPRAHDWARVEEELATLLPSDYKQLVDLYGGVFDDAIWVLEPDCPNKHYDPASENRIRVAAQQGLWTGGEPKPCELDGTGSRTIAWAVTENGDNVWQGYESIRRYAEQALRGNAHWTFWWD